MSRHFFYGSSLLLSLQLLITACGGGNSSKKVATAPLGPVTAAFVKSSQTHHIPQEILLALAFKESGIDPKPSAYPYGSSKQGPRLSETAVGLPVSSLGLKDDEAQDLTRQLDAYGAWVQSNLETQHISLPQVITKNDDIYDWVWQLARMHHGGPQASKNVQIIFAREMLQTLNQGFLWQDPDSKERLELKARNPKLEPSSFSPPIQANLKLDTRTSELFFVDYMQVTYGNTLGLENQAKRIKVIHCPYSLSTCIGDQLQARGPTPSVPMEAHYVIPADEEILVNPIKILQHRNPVRTMDAEGHVEITTDAIVVMLTGVSGRYNEGQRFAVNPSWYSRSQLRNLGKLTAGICELLAREQSGFDISACRSLDLGVQFQAPSANRPFQFGDIPDFDNKIFGSFIINPDDLSGEISLDLPQNQKIYPAGSRIQPQLSFIKGTAKIEVQLLERCANGKTAWTSIQTHFLRNSTLKGIELTLYDQGPNRNGQQFLRALAYDNQGKLMGWATNDLYLTGYDVEGSPLPDHSECHL